MPTEAARPRVVVYDPNGLNPYGVEVAHLLTSLVPRVDYFGVASRMFPRSHDFVVHASLGESTGRRSFRSLLRRLLGPIRVVLSAGLKDPLVLIWVRDPWDSALFLLRALFGGNTLMIYHNPAEIRPRSGMIGRLERRLLRHVRVCVHATWMAELVSRRSRNVSVTPHPPYSFSVRSRRSTLREVEAVPRVAILGSLRPDKGYLDLPSVAIASGGGWVLRIVGPSILDAAVAEELRQAGVMHEYAEGEIPPSDAEVEASLADCAVMLAPYRQVTESGSVLLALSLGIPVIGYESAALERLVSPESLASDADELGQRLRDFLVEPWETFRLTQDEVLAQSRLGWRQALV